MYGDHTQTPKYTYFAVPSSSPLDPNHIREKERERRWRLKGEEIERIETERQRKEKVKYFNRY